MKYKKKSNFILKWKLSFCNFMLFLCFVVFVFSSFFAFCHLLHCQILFLFLLYLKIPNAFFSSPYQNLLILKDISFCLTCSSAFFALLFIDRRNNPQTNLYCFQLIRYHMFLTGSCFIRFVSLHVTITLRV